MRIPVTASPGEVPRGHEPLSRNWWAVALRGAIALIAGIVCLAMPGVTLVTILILAAAYFLADGVLSIIATVRAARRHERWWPFVIEGLLDLAAGVAIIVWPGISLVAFTYLVAVWAIFTGVIMAMGAGMYGGGWARWLLGLGGVLSVLLGVIMIAQPAAGVLALIGIFAAYLLMFGAVLLSFGLWLRNHQHLPAAPAMAE